MLNFDSVRFLNVRKGAVALAPQIPRPSAATRVLVSPMVLASALERLIAHLAVKRQHPLNIRRYYKRVPY
jgi:fructoselysine-6-P-deglycase FrlB-like protein